MGFLDGKRALITGIASHRSIAWGIAQAMHRQGAQRDDGGCAVDRFEARGAFGRVGGHLVGAGPSHGLRGRGEAGQLEEAVVGAVEVVAEQVPAAPALQQAPRLDASRPLPVAEGQLDAAEDGGEGRDTLNGG